MLLANKKFWLYNFIFLSFIFHCSSQNTSTTDNAETSCLPDDKTCNDKSNQKDKKTETKTTEEDDVYGSDELINGGVPTIKTLRPNDRFNQNKAKEIPLDPADKDKIFRVQRVCYYRAIYLEYRLGFWFPFGELAGIVDPGAQPTGGFSFSIHQPLPQAADAQVTYDEDYYVLGHTATFGHQFPIFCTAVLSNKIAPQDAVNFPTDYVKVFEHKTQNMSDIMEYCNKNYNEVQQKGATPGKNDSLYCSEMTGLSTVTHASDVTQGRIKVQDASEYITKSSLVIWKPVPPPGYQCIGHLATNGDKPEIFSSSATEESMIQHLNTWDNQTSIYGENASIPSERSTICIKQDYLVECQYKEFIKSDANQIHLYVQSSSDGTGYDQGNFFVALKGTVSEVEKIKNTEKMWCLKKDILRFLPDKKRQ